MSLLVLTCCCAWLVSSLLLLLLNKQAVAGARLVKMSAWEPALSREINNARAAEVRTDVYNIIYF
jgi:hypothetical protein